MEDIDLEIKKVQLAREKLALERELALIRATDRAKKVAKSVSAPITAIERFLDRYARKIAFGFIFVVVAVVAASAAYSAYSQHQKRISDEALEEWNTQRYDHARKLCGTMEDCWGLARKGEGNETLACLDANDKRSPCFESAFSAFDKMNPRPQK